MTIPAVEVEGCTRIEIAYPRHTLGRMLVESSEETVSTSFLERRDNFEGRRASYVSLHSFFPAAQP